jgi:hypothetical protein
VRGKSLALKDEFSRGSIFLVSLSIYASERGTEKAAAASSNAQGLEQESHSVRD